MMLLFYLALAALTTIHTNAKIPNTVPIFCSWTDSLVTRDEDITQGCSQRCECPTDVTGLQPSPNETEEEEFYEVICEEDNTYFAGYDCEDVCGCNAEHYQ